MKVLLVGNIANNSYSNAKFLRRKGIEADVLCYNYTHIMGQPEWEDADFIEEVDQFFPDWNKIDLNGYKRPEWFFQKTLVPSISRKHKLALAYYKFLAPSPYTRKIAQKITPFLHRYYRKWQLGKRIPGYVKELLKPVFYFIYFGGGSPQIENISFFDPEEETDKILKNQNIIRDFKQLFPWREDTLTRDDIMPYISALLWFRKEFSGYDIIQACALEPIYAMLAAPEKPFVAFEHGTLRDFPFTKNAQGRLLSLAYTKAKRVIITNPDTVVAAKKLGLTNYVFIPHPIDETIYTPQETYLHNELRYKYGVEYVLFCPIRHDWEVKGTDIQIRGFAKYLKKYKKPSLLILSRWGEETVRSMELIRELDIEKNVLWLYPPHKRKYISYINASDIVLDQMIYPHFGATAPEAMSCGKPVITSFRYDAVRWCLKEPPPLVSAFNDDETCDKINELLNDKKMREEIGKKGREWIIKHHSWELVADKLIAVYKETLGAQWS